MLLNREWLQRRRNLTHDRKTGAVKHMHGLTHGHTHASVSMQVIKEGEESSLKAWVASLAREKSASAATANFLLSAVRRRVVACVHLAQCGLAW